MSEFTFHCPHCGQKFKANESDKGKRAQCPSCSNEILIMGDISYEEEDNMCNMVVKTNENYSSPKKEYFYCYLCHTEYEDIKENEGEKRFCPHCSQAIFIEKTMNIFLCENHFNVDKKIVANTKSIFVDQKHKLLLIILKNNIPVTTLKNVFQQTTEAIFLPFSKIIDWEILTKSSSKISGNGTIEGRMGRSIIGSVLAGTDGAIAGASGKRNVHIEQTIETTNRYDLIISINDIKMNSVSLEVLSEKTLSEIISVLKFAKHNAIQEKSSVICTTLVSG